MRQKEYAVPKRYGELDLVLNGFLGHPGYIFVHSDIRARSILRGPTDIDVQYCRTALYRQESAVSL